MESGQKEHMKDVKQLGINYTRAKKRVLQTEHHQSALTDHAAVCKHTIHSEGVKLPAKDSDWSKRCMIRYHGGHLHQDVRGSCHQL